MKNICYFLFTSLIIGGTLGGDETPDKTPAQCILPMSERKRNTGGRDGAGLCVFTSIEHAAKYQNVFQLKDFQAWMKQYPGGGYPEKTDRMIAKLCSEKGYPKPKYIHIQGKDIDILRLATQCGRMPSVTYGVSFTGRYGGQKISHMVNLIHADDKFFGILDNNYIDKIEWLSLAEFKNTYEGGGGWAVILLNPGPPPVPLE